jgi:hypothetical protein
MCSSLVMGERKLGTCDGKCFCIEGNENMALSPRTRYADTGSAVMTSMRCVSLVSLATFNTTMKRDAVNKVTTDWEELST